MWKRYFNFIKLVPGKVVTHQFGTIDFRDDNIPIETIKTLYENDFPYLQITKEGETQLYGTSPVIENSLQPTKKLNVKKKKKTP